MTTAQNFFIGRTYILNCVCFGLFILALILVTPTMVMAQETDQALPDLIVTNIQLTPELPSIGTQIQVLVTVENIGPVTAPPSRLVLRIDRLPKDQRLPEIGANSAIIVTYDTVLTRNKSEFSAEANWAIPFIDESNTDNNTFGRLFEFTPDLVIENIRFSPSNPLPNTSTQILITIKNVGGQTMTSSTAISVKDGRNQLVTLTINPPLAPGQSQEVLARWQPQRGEHVLRFDVDSFERVIESDEGNNSFSGIINISPNPPTGANLVVREIGISPDNPQPGQVVQLGAVIANEGTGISGNVGMNFEIDGVLLQSLNVPQLAPGESRLITTAWTAVEGERLFRVKVDPQGDLVEPNEVDNTNAAFLEINPILNDCTQLIYLNLEDEATKLLASTLGVSDEEIHNSFMPNLKSKMEKDFEGFNVKFTLRGPTGTHSQVLLKSDSRTGILGLAPLDDGNLRKNDIGQVFIGSFTNLLQGRRLLRTTLDQIAQSIANTASHEAGHFLGLEHDIDSVTRQFGGRNLMAPSNEANSFFEDAFFTEANKDYLASTLPFNCQ